MSAPAPTPRDPATAEPIATAIAQAERRMWLVKMMIRFCMALLGALKPGGAADALLASTKDRAFVAISRAVCRAMGLEAETCRLLCDLRAGILPALKAGRTDSEPADEREDFEDLDEYEDLWDRETRDPIATNGDKAFRERLEALEASGGSPCRLARARDDQAPVPGAETRARLGPLAR